MRRLGIPRRLSPSVLAVVLVALFAATAGAQPRAESIRGRVTTDSGRAIVAADVILTMAPNRDVFRGATDSTGRYEVKVAQGTGDYLLYIGAPGRRAFRKRLLRNGPDSVFVVDAVLPKEVTTVAAVRTTAQRTRPPRGDETPGTVGALTTQFGGVAGALSPDQMGDLAAMASTIPGVAVTPDGGISVFGLDPSQNRSTLNGMTFDGASLPRDLPTRTRVSTSAYDPSIGGFGGALIAVDISPGQTLTFGRGHVTLDAPQLQAADATARQLGQRYAQFLSSYGRSGEMAQDLWVYSGAVQGSRRMSPAPSIVTADAPALQRLGVSADSANRFLQLIGGAGVPLRLAGVGDDFASTSVSGAFRLDRAQTYSLGGVQTDTKAHIGLVGVGSYNTSEPTFASALAPPTHDGHTNSGNVSLQAIVSQYLGADAMYLSETRTALSFNIQQASPYLALPGGYVRVTSVLPDGSESIAGLQFGGASSESDTRTWRWEASNELSFNPASALAHRIKLFTQAQVDGYQQTSQANALGTFTYNSLGDLTANAPASFSRTLFTPDRTGGEVSGALALADFWTKSPELQFVFGPRVEWSAFTQSPADNPEIVRLFGAHTNVTPAAIHVSPRFGFSWLYPGARVAGRGGMSASQLGTQFTPPKGVLRGGFGEFRSPFAPSLVSNAIVATGLPGTTTQRLSCVGSAVPTPNWQNYISNAASVPSTCADGAGASPFSDAAPSVQLFDSRFAAARRWTGNLSWASAYHWLFYTIDGSYSLNVDQPGTVDLNFTGTPRFTLANEDNRPVFVSPTSIVPSTGLVSPLDARSTTEFGRVLSRRSDLRSDVKQGTVSILPYLPQRLAQVIASASYTYADSRSLTRGFDGATFGDPSLREWASGFMPRHQLRLAAGYRIPKVNGSFTTYWAFQSGFPYTPLVSGDINGDGLSNDRAFVFSPSASPTAAVATGMSNLLVSTTSEARDCLLRQLGDVAGRNSCQRPWSATMNARFNWNHQFGDRYHYVTGSINFANPLAGIDQALHGGDHLHGWGLPAAPDPTLYFVRGFDPAANRFLYEVNPRFGNTRPSVAALYNPFRITLDVSFSINGNVQKQQLSVYLRPTRGAPGQRPPADTILKRLHSTGASPVSAYYWIIANADSLLLSPEQLTAATAGAARRAAWIDSTYAALAKELAALPENYDADAAMQRVQRVNQSIFQWPESESAFLRGLLTPIQLRLLPSMLASMLAPPKR